MIKAKAHSDDYEYDVAFDATDWFKQASDKEITDLIKCEWGGDLPADAIVHFFEDDNTEIDLLLAHCHYLHDAGKECGFECHVNEKDAKQWLKEHKPHIPVTL